LAAELGEVVVVQALEERLVMRAPKALAVASTALCLAASVARAEPPRPPAPSASVARPALVVDRHARTSLELTSGIAVASLRGRGVEPTVVAREEREVALAEGANELVWEDVPEQLHADTVDVRVGPGVTIESLRIVDRVPGPVGLEAFLKDKQVDARPYGYGSDPLRRERPVAPRWSGAVVSLEGGLVLRTGASLSVLPASEVTLHDPAAARVPRRLELRLRADKASKATIVVTALVEKIVVHEAHYVLSTDAAAHTLHLRGTMAVTNGSGMALDGAGLHLGAFGLGSTAGRHDDPRDLAGTFVIGGGSPYVAFDVAEKLRFSSTGVAEPTFVDRGGLPFAERFESQFLSLDQIRQKNDGPLSLDASHVYVVPAGASPSLPVGLPSGPGWLMSPGGAAPAALAKGHVYVDRNGDLTLAAREYGVGVVARSLSGRDTEDCVVTSKWEHAVAATLLARGPVRLALPFDKRTLDLSFPKTEGVAVEVLRDGSRALVFSALPPGQADRSHDPPRKVVVTYKTNRCVR